MVKPYPPSLTSLRPAPSASLWMSVLLLVEAYEGTHARQLVSIVSHYDHTLGQQLFNGVVIMAHYRG